MAELHVRERSLIAKKFGILSIRENLVMTSAYDLPSVQTGERESGVTAESSEGPEMQNFTSKRLVFHLNPRDGHVIFVSAHLILTAVNSSTCGWLM